MLKVFLWCIYPKRNPHLTAIFISQSVLKPSKATQFTLFYYTVIDGDRSHCLITTRGRRH